MARAGSISSRERAGAIDGLERETFDLLLIGGGITGAGTAFEAARRGLRVALLEASDFAAGTSSRSSKLIHGGLRYLAQGEVGLVRETALERKEIHRLAPHLAEPRWMVLPARSRAGAARFRLALTTYEKLGAVDAADVHRNWGRRELERELPLLDVKAHPYGVAYREYLTDDARLVLANLRGAAARGARALNHAPAVAVLHEGERVCGVEARCSESGRAFRVRARCVVNAAGPWVEAVRRLEEADAPPWLHLSNGIHVSLPFQRLPLRHILMMNTGDRRTIFAIPRGEVTYLGTTDTSYAGGPEVWPEIREEDVAYLLEPVARYFRTDAPGVGEVIGAWAGLRPLVAEKGKAPSEISRKDEIVVGPRGLVSIAGGKLTGYRPMAQSVLEHVASVLEQTLPPAEEDEVLPGGDFDGDLDALAGRLAGDAGLDPEAVRPLARLYGTEAKRVLALGAEPLVGSARLLCGEVDWAVLEEGATSVNDVLYRRNRSALWAPETARAAAEPVARRMAQLLGWDEARTRSEADALRARMAADLSFAQGSR